MNENLEKSILQTSAYFDVFDFPLTKEEIQKWLWGLRITDPLCQSYSEASNADLRIKLNELEECGKFDSKDGFYFLAGRSENVAKRQLAVPGFERKLRVARRAAKKLRWVPFCRAMFVCNTVGASMIGDGSDIDVFIIVKKDRIWLVRFLATIILQLWRLRLRGKNVKDKICLSFYTTDDNLDLSEIALPEPDIYLVYWLDHLIPIYNPDNLRTEILRANTWARKYLPGGFQNYELTKRLQVIDNKFSKLSKNFFEKLWDGSYGDLLEAQARKIQMAKIARREELKNKSSKEVMINDKMLKFHENDRRERFRSLWEEKCNHIL